VQLGLAAQKGRVEIFRQLLQAGANPHIADKKGRKALQVARETKCKACVELLSEFHRLSGEGSADDGGGGGDGEGLFRLEL
jgi:ankyrin repeat protein